MKRVALSLIGFAAIGAVHAFRHVEPALQPEHVLHRESASGSVARVLRRSGDGDDEARRADVRTKLRASEAGTYIDDILLERDSALARWHDRPDKPLTVWIQPTTRIADWSPDFVTAVRAAFMEWDQLALPVHFMFVGDSAKAEIHLTWIDHFTEPISGRTKWARDDNWWITDASIVLALHHQQGEALDADAMKAIALHEVGHLLGLDHTSDPDAIMSPRVRVRDLTAADRATVRLLYTLLPGPIGKQSAATVH
jgi:predicted Zn-dependent protease